MIETLLDLSGILLTFALLNFVLSIVLKRNDIADVAWGIGFIIVVIYLYYSYEVTPAAMVVYLLVLVWGSRLSIYIGVRNSRKKEDFRYKKWREEWGKTFYWRSLLQVFVLQMLIVLVIAAPVIIVGLYSAPGKLNIMQWCSVMLWLIGFVWQALADYQLSQFKKNNPGAVMTTGLWKYSRHPNYFGEIVMWWSFFLISLSCPYGHYSIVGPVMITFLIAKVSGVPMLEEKYNHNREYQTYVDQTPAVIPFLK